MRAIAPRIEGAPESTIAEDQLEYSPIVVAYLTRSDGSVERVCRWTFSPDERSRIAAGEDIYFESPAQLQLIPHYLRVGPP